MAANTRPPPQVDFRIQKSHWNGANHAVHTYWLIAYCRYKFVVVVVLCEKTVIKTVNHPWPCFVFFISGVNGKRTAASGRTVNKGSGNK